MNERSAHAVRDCGTVGDVRDDNARPVCNEGFRDRPADPRRAARYERGFTLE